MLSPSLEVVGFAAAVLTTLCWLPQAFKIIRYKRTSDISLWTQAVFVAGVALWLGYGVLAGSPSIIVANGCTLALSALILGLKLRYG